MQQGLTSNKLGGASKERQPNNRSSAPEGEFRPAHEKHDRRSGRVTRASCVDCVNTEGTDELGTVFFSAVGRYCRGLCSLDKMAS